MTQVRRFQPVSARLVCLYHILTSAAAVQGWLDQRGHKVGVVKHMMKSSPVYTLMRGAILVCGWAVVVYLFRRVLEAAKNSELNLYDPFAILGIAASATEREIRRRYRRLSLEFHPDKVGSVSNKTKEQIESHYIEITKAYKALTDEVTRKNYEEYGHPDGRQEMSMGIALPTWIVDSKHNVPVLLMYGLVFGVGLPLLVARWWYGTRSRTKDGVLNATALSFFLKLKPDVSANGILLMMAQSEELSRDLVGRLSASDMPAYEQLEKKTIDAYRELRGSDLVPEHVPVNVRRALVLFTAYMYRIESGNLHIETIKYDIGYYAEKLLRSLMAMSTAHSRLNQTNVIRDMLAHVVQAVPLDGGRVSELLQLPHMTLHLAKKLCSIEPVAKLGLQGLWKVPEAERHALLVGDKDGMSEEQYRTCIRAVGEWPRIELVDAYYTVIGEERVSAGSLMHLVLKLRLLSMKRDGSILRNGRRLDARDKRDDNVRSGLTETETISEANAGREPMGYVHAPYFKEERSPGWFMQMGDPKSDHLIMSPTRFGELGVSQLRVVTAPIVAPPEPGIYTFQVEINSDSYLGSKAVKVMKLNVSEAVAPNEDEEDEISDPEEDTIAGQMALMRGERVKRSNVVYQEDDDDDDDDEEEDDDNDDDDDSDEDEDDDNDDDDSDRDGKKKGRATLSKDSDSDSD